MDGFNADEFLPQCRRCGESIFRRVRELAEHEYLELDADGDVSGDGGDVDIVGDWKIECDHCGASSEDLEELLAFKPDEGEEGDE